MVGDCWDRAAFATVAALFVPSGSPPNRQGGSQREEVASFSETGVGHFESGRRLVDFLQANDGKPVKLNVSFSVTTFDLTPGAGTDPWVLLYDDPCGHRPPPGTEPDAVKHACVGTQINVSGQKPDAPSKLYYSSFPRIQGYFAVQSGGGEMHQGISAVNLRALSFEDAQASR